MENHSALGNRASASPVNTGTARTGPKSSSGKLRRILRAKKARKMDKRAPAFITSTAAGHMPQAHQHQHQHQHQHSLCEAKTATAVGSLAYESAIGSLPASLLEASPMGPSPSVLPASKTRSVDCARLSANSGPSSSSWKRRYPKTPAILKKQRRLGSAHGDGATDTSDSTAASGCGGNGIHSTPPKHTSRFVGEEQAKLQQAWAGGDVGGSELSSLRLEFANSERSGLRFLEHLDVR